MNYERHPISGSWPDMLQDDFVALKDSINVSGLRDPIVLFEGMILDGWHRYSACKEIGFEPVFVNFTDDDPIQYVQDKHTRRPLNLTQRMTAIALMHAWQPVGKPSNCAPGAYLTSQQLAKAAGGSIRTAVQVKEAITKGSAALVDGMKSGKTSAKKASAVAKLPKRQQAAALDKPLPKPEPANAPKIAIAPLALVEEYSELDAARDQIEALQDALAVANIGSANSDEAAQAKNLIAELRAHIKTLEATLKAVKTSRDGFQNQVAELQKQINRQRREIDKLAGTRTA